MFERATETMPPKAAEIKPHPSGMEIGDMMTYSSLSQESTVKDFLAHDFCRMTARLAEEICKKAGVSPKSAPADLGRDGSRKLIEGISQVKILPPPSDCLSPIGDVLIKKGLMHILDGERPEFYATPVTRPAHIYNGNPFTVEAGIVYGGDIPSDGPVTIMRFANRVPLLFQQGADVITKAVGEVDWRRYGLEQRGGKGIPYGSAIILVHVASTKVPFTSEGKEAVAAYPEIEEEIVAALKGSAKSLRSHLNKQAKKDKTHEKFDIVQKILPDLAAKVAEELGKPVPDISRTVSKIMNVIWFEPESSSDRKTGVRHIKFSIYNYTVKERRFMVHMPLPPQAIGDSVKNHPLLDSTSPDGKTQFMIENLAPSGVAVLEFDLTGDMADTFDLDEVYISGVNPVIVMGAEGLPGDWGIKGLEITEIDEVETEDTAEEDLEEEEMEFEKEADDE